VICPVIIPHFLKQSHVTLSEEVARADDTARAIDHAMKIEQATGRRAA
jgi:hypothetical protein